MGEACEVLQWSDDFILSLGRMFGVAVAIEVTVLAIRMDSIRLQKLTDLRPKKTERWFPQRLKLGRLELLLERHGEPASISESDATPSIKKKTAEVFATLDWMKWKFNGCVSSSSTDAVPERHFPSQLLSAGVPEPPKRLKTRSPVRKIAVKPLAAASRKGEIVGTVMSDRAQKATKQIKSWPEVPVFSEKSTLAAACPRDETTKKMASDRTYYITATDLPRKFRVVLPQNTCPVTKKAMDNATLQFPMKEGDDDLKRLWADAPVLSMPCATCSTWGFLRIGAFKSFTAVRSFRVDIGWFRSTRGEQGHYFLCPRCSLRT